MSGEQTPATGNEPTDRTGSIKQVIPAFVQNAWTNHEIVAGA